MFIKIIIFTILFNGGQALQAFHGCRNNLNYSLEFNFVTETLNLTKMNYQKIYNDLIKKAKSENRKKLKRNNPNFIYYENHHILPKCLGGGNEKENLVLLTGREHFIAHKILIEVYPKEKTLRCAVWRMCNSNTIERSYDFSSRQYNYFRESHCEVVRELSSKFRHSEETKAFLSEIRKKENLSDETLKKMSESQRKKPPVTEETKKKLSKSNTGRVVSEETKKKIKFANSGEKSPNYGLTGEKHPSFGTKKSQHSIDKQIKTRKENRLAGKHKDTKGYKHKPETIEKYKRDRKGTQVGKKNHHYNKSHSEESKRKMSETKQKAPIRTCLYCGKTGKGGGMTRYHFNNCKKNPNCEAIEKTIVCPYCSKSSNSSANMKRHHFDNCKKNPNYIHKEKEILICPHCGKESTNKSNMTRWHFGKCKHK